MAKTKRVKRELPREVPDLGPEQRLDVRQVAALMGVGVQTVLDLCDPDSPKLRHLRPTPKRIWILRKDYDAYMANSVIEPKAGSAASP